jgi:hypothetical protein
VFSPKTPLKTLLKTHKNTGTKLGLRVVLTTLRTHELKAKLRKCIFGQPQVEYLGHIISGQGFATDPKKIEDIVQWKTPNTVKKLRGFLGLTGYYRRFIKGYASAIHFTKY